jgi:hypothetical protein
MLIVAANVRADPVFLYVNPHNHQIAFTKDRADATKFEDDTQAAIACAVFSLKFNVANPRVEAA